MYQIVLRGVFIRKIFKLFVDIISVCGILLATEKMLMDRNKITPDLPKTPSRKAYEREQQLYWCGIYLLEKMVLEVC